MTEDTSMVLITGSSGFVGKNLMIFLKKNGILFSGISLKNDNWVHLFHKGYSSVIHLAGKAHDTSNVSDSYEYFKVNTDLTIKLFDEFLKSEINDFIYFSSVKAVADSVDGILEENVIANPQTPYGQSKLLAEQYLLSKIIPDGKRLFILRPCMIHGPGNKSNLNLLYKVVKKGIPWPLVVFENKRSFLSIDNLNFLLLSILCNQTLKGGVYNIADDDALSTNQLINLISEVIGKKVVSWSFSPNFIKGVAKVGDKLNFSFNSERLKKLTESYVVDNQKIKVALKIEQLPISVKDGLIKTIQSFNNG